MNEDKMKSEEAEVYLKKISNEYKTYGDLDNPEFENTTKIVEAIETVLKDLKSYKKRYELALEQNVKDYKNLIPKKKIEEIYNNNEPMTITERVEFYQRKLKELLEDK